MINCIVCGELIVKYKLDLSDSVSLFIQGNKKDFVEGKWVYVCDDCAKECARQLIDR